MNVQQYALTNPRLSERKRYSVWLSGLFLYCFAQLVCTAALSFSPLSLVAALFTTMLIFDALIGRFLITQKPLPPTSVIGLGVIFLSVVVVAAFGPKEEYAITADCLMYWVQAPQGVSAIVLLGVIFGVNWLIFRWFVATYPHFREMELSGSYSQRGKIPKALFLLMQVVYPTILAVTETIGSLALKSISAMVVNALTSKAGAAELFTPAFALLATVYTGAVCAIILWLRVVYSRFTTSECLGTEYGLVAIFSISSSLGFYQEHKDPNVNIALISTACVGILIGIAILVFGEEYCPCIGTDMSLLSEVDKRSRDLQRQVAVTINSQQAGTLVWRSAFTNWREQTKGKLVKQVLKSHSIDEISAATTKHLHLEFLKEWVNSHVTNAQCAVNTAVQVVGSHTCRGLGSAGVKQVGPSSSGGAEAAGGVPGPPLEQASSALRAPVGRVARDGAAMQKIVTVNLGAKTIV
jgi:drug/metabolite transporter (DMT)-like permease